MCGDSVYGIIRDMEKIATDIYSFRELRENGFTYIDKTAILLPLCDLSIGKQFFIARPRRFGKSLLISTLQCLFEGRRELFKGLAIEPKWDWSKSWPVIHLDMGDCQATTVDRHWEKIRECLVLDLRQSGRPQSARRPRPRVAEGRHGGVPGAVHAAAALLSDCRIPSRLKESML